MTSIPLHTLTEFHVRHNCTLTALLVRPPKEDDLKKKSTFVERDIIALADDSKMVYFTAMADLDDDLTLSRNMIKRLRVEHAWPHCLLASTKWWSHVERYPSWGGLELSGPTSAG